MSFFNPLYQFPLPKKWAAMVRENAQRLIQENGNLPKWLAAIENFPDLNPAQVKLDSNVIKIGDATNLSEYLKTSLLKLSPWRKGPFQVFDVSIETEWRSDLKWNRLKDKLDLSGKRVLDVGCGNGYHLLRMMGAGASQAVGIDPSILFIVQFLTLRHWMKNTPNAMILPFKLEDLPKDLETFDVVFSMGVLYHRRSPLDHLFELKAKLNENGVLILETLVVEGELGFNLMPKDRYAKMRNVWFIPSVLTLLSWLTRANFKNCEIIDISTTTIDEQRKTQWMQFESLTDFLHPNDNSQTIENYPAPKRALIKANL